MVWQTKPDRHPIDLISFLPSHTSAAFIGPNPILPMYKGVIQCAMLGVALECFDDNGNPLTNGEEGDLVVTQPLPNMPLGFLGDDENKTRFRDAYFNRYKKVVWYQADFSTSRMRPPSGSCRIDLGSLFVND